MRRTAILMLAAVAVIGAAALPLVTTAVARPASADAQFAGISKRYIDGIAEFAPGYGTQLGDHRFDDKISDVSTAGATSRSPTNVRCSPTSARSTARR